jgi:hypothetical protein
MVHFMVQLLITKKIKNMENERILIHQNDVIIKQIDQAYLKEKTLLTDRVNALMALYSEFDETFSSTGTTKPKYLSLLTTGVQVHIDAAINKIKSEFTTAGITSSAILDIAIQRTSEKGNALLQAYNDLLKYPEVKTQYLELKVPLNNINFVDGLASIDNEVNLEGLKDGHARQYIDTQVGHDLVAKAQSLVDILNGINQTLRENGVYNITDLRDFSDFAEYKFPNQGSNSQLELNVVGTYNYVNRMKGG